MFPRCLPGFSTHAASFILFFRLSCGSLRVCEKTLVSERVRFRNQRHDKSFISSSLSTKRHSCCCCSHWLLTFTHATIKRAFYLVVSSRLLLYLSTISRKFHLTRTRRSRVLEASHNAHPVARCSSHTAPRDPFIIKTLLYRTAVCLAQPAFIVATPGRKCSTCGTKESLLFRLWVLF